MTKPIPYRALARLLTQAGFVARQGKGDHVVWSGPNGVSVSIAHKRECSAGVHSDALKAIAQSQVTPIKEKEEDK